jgi:hypothetical protein
MVARPILTQRIPAALKRAHVARSYQRRFPWARGESLSYLRRCLEPAAPPPRDPQEAATWIVSRIVRETLIDLMDHRAQLETAACITRSDPMLDPELISLAAAIPRPLLLYGDDVRGLFRAGLRGLIPERVRARPDKSYFEPALMRIVDKSDRGRLEELAEARALADLGLVEPRAFKRQFETVLAHGGHGCLSVWPALATEAFVRAYG